MSKSLRIRTTPGGNDKYIKFKLEQDFDFLEILSLKLTQDEVYQRFCSDYGVVVGRVIANNGIGVPNAKVSIFIPLSDEDRDNPVISALYPYKNITDVNSDGVRYNLLPKNTTSDCYSPIGTMPSKREILDNEVMVEVYEKYYKFTTKTNNSGDYMLFGVPTGTHTLHMDVDLSDIGILSQRPYDLISYGYTQDSFESSVKFKKDNNLDTLPQVKSTDVGVNVLPFWGDNEICEVGISRVDINLAYYFRPSAIFMGSLFSDSEKNSINKQCRPRKKLGELCETVTSSGTIEMIRKTLDGGIERFDVKGGRVIDDNGTWAYQIPMNLDYKVTDEFGNLIDSDDPNKGIPTRSDVRFRVGMDQTGDEGRLRTRAKYLIPNKPELFTDFSFDETTKDESFYPIRWNKIYTVKNLITRYQRGGESSYRRTFIGIKNVDNCGSHNPFPYNRIDISFNFLYTIICYLMTIIATLISIINLTVVNLVNGVIKAINAVLKLFCKLIWGLRFLSTKKKRFCAGEYDDGDCECGEVINYIRCITIKCNEQNYAPGCLENTEGYTNLIDLPVYNELNNYIECNRIQLGDNFNVFEFEFYNDWINGSLYLPLIKYKKKRNESVEKYCKFDCGDDCKNAYIVDTCAGTANNLDEDNINFIKIKSGLIKKYDDEFYYTPLSKLSTTPLFMTDLLCLGSVSDYDVDNYPKIINDLSPTSYKIPENIVTNLDGSSDGDLNDEASIGDLFFSDVTCTDFKLGKLNCQNINIACELGVDFGDEGNKIISESDINSSLLRRKIMGINSDIINYDFINIDDRFRIGDEDHSFYTDASFENDYTQFRGLDPERTLADINIPSDNSFYFYFGIKPGKSAFDKMLNKYISPCVIPKTNDFIIDGTIQDVTTIGGSDGSIILDIIGGSEPYNYLWSNGLTTKDIVNLTAGSYDVTVTDGQGLIGKRNFVVQQPIQLDFNLTTKNLTTNNSNDGEIYVDFIYGGQPDYTIELYKDSNLVSGPITTVLGHTFSNLSVGTYQVKVIDSLGEFITKDGEISEPLPVSYVLTFSDVKCYNSNTGILNIIPKEGVRPYTIEITGNDYISNSFIVNNLGVGTYNFVITDNIGQTVSGSQYISNTSPITFDHTIEEIVCNGDSGSVTVSNIVGGVSPYYYSVDFGNSYYEITDILSLPEDSYGLVVKDSNNCESSTIEFTLTNPLVLNNTSSVADSELTFSAEGGTGGYTFSLDGINYPYSAGDTYSAVGTYTVYVKDNNGCIKTKQVTI